MQLDQLSSTEYLEHVDWTVECESVHHHNPAENAVEHGGFAAYYVLGPCSHTTGFRCEPAVLCAMALVRGICDRCKSSWPSDRFTYWRL